MLRCPQIRLILVLPALLAILLPVFLVGRGAAQDNPGVDPNDVPLGDVARSLRKKTPASQDVIDDDNLSQVMQQAESHHTAGSALTFLMSGESKGFQVSAPDVSCSLSFNANAKSLLSGQYAQMDLPPADVVKLSGPATIEGDALTVSVFNGTDWHVSEVAVALTVVKKNEAGDTSLYSGTFNSGTSRGGDPAVGSPPPGLSQESQVRPERKPDVTIIYRMRAAAAPFATTVFSAPLSRDLTPGEEWHWAIVQAKGYPPQSYGAGTPQTTAQTDPASIRSTVPGSLLVPQDSPEASLPPIPQ